MSGIGSPNTGNYAVGKGFILFKPDGASEFRHVGNVPTFEFTPNITTLDHFSSMEGTKTKDLTLVLEKGGTVKMDMEEITAANLAMLVLGDVDVSDPTQPSVSIFSRSSLAGAVRYYGTNDVGPRIFIDLLRVVFNPSGALSPISDGKIGVLPVTGSVEAVDGNFGTITFLPSILDAAPINILAPYIEGQKSPASSPMAASIGETMTAILGAWTGATSISYQWLADAAPISGATSKTYVPVSGDSGAVLTVTVTATNATGSTAVTSAATAAVA